MPSGCQRSCCSRPRSRPCFPFLNALWRAFLVWSIWLWPRWRRCSRTGAGLATTHGPGTCTVRPSRSGFRVAGPRRARPGRHSLGWGAPRPQRWSRSVLGSVRPFWTAMFVASWHDRSGPWSLGERPPLPTVSGQRPRQGFRHRARRCLATLRRLWTSEQPSVYPDSLPATAVLCVTSALRLLLADRVSSPHRRLGGSDRHAKSTGHCRFEKAVRSALWSGLRQASGVACGAYRSSWSHRPVPPCGQACGTTSPIFSCTCRSGRSRWPMVSPRAASGFRGTVRWRAPCLRLFVESWRGSSPGLA